MEVIRHTFSASYVPWLLGAAYLLGSIPFGLLLTRRFARTDVRAHGSGNIGATNVARVAGRKLGILTLVLDCVKGAVAVFIPMHLIRWPPETNVGLLAGTAGLTALIGHCFPIWLRFKGGKGVATGLGVVIALMPITAVVGLSCFGIAVAITRLVSVGSLVAAVAVLLFLAFFSPTWSALPVVGCALVIVLRHTENIRRLVQRSELRV